MLHTVNLKLPRTVTTRGQADAIFERGLLNSEDDRQAPGNVTALVYGRGVETLTAAFTDELARLIISNDIDHIVIDASAPVRESIRASLRRRRAQAIITSAQDELTQSASSETSTTEKLASNNQR